MLSLGENSTTPQTYIIAQNAAVLAQLMRENENRPLNPSAYNTPATVFNTLGVHVDASKSEPIANEKPMLPLKTVMLPASEILKLNPTIDNNLHFITTVTNADEQTTTYKCHKQTLSNNSNSQTSLSFPIPCEIINTKTHQVLSVDPMYTALQSLNICQNVTHSTNSPPTNEDSIQKTRSLERNLTYISQISSLDRTQNSTHSKHPRSSSLTRQLSSGFEVSTSNYPGTSFSGSGTSYSGNSRSASLERGARIGTVNYGFRNNSFDCSNKQQVCQPISVQCIPCDNQHGENFNPMNNYNRGSLERNIQGT